VRVRLQSYLLPAVLLLCLFFCTAAYSEKKNRVYGEDADRDVKFYNSDYKKRAAGSDRDIISYNKINKNEDDYEEYSESKGLRNPDEKKKSDINRIKEKEKSPTLKNREEFLYYIVKNGDTLFGIAKRSGVTLKEIQDINDLSESSKIYKGMKLKVPCGKVSGKVAKKETGNYNKEYSETKSSSKPAFLWPLKKVKGFSRDGKDGVKSIGIVIKGNPGGDVVASENGVVKRVGYMRGYGKYIVVKHEKRYITVYSNLMDVDVKAGDTVQKGVRIGNISDDMTLHFQIDREGKPENPLSLLPGRG
jgi:lipoprotein NlpD